MIEVRNLHKRFGELVAVDSLTFSIAPGEIVGLLGPNGAGKTTTMRIISGLSRPTGGSVTVGGLDVTSHPQQVQARLGIMPDGGGLYRRLTARENIHYFGELQGMSGRRMKERIETLSDILGMGNIIDRRAAGFSHGERTKVALARAIIHEPDYVLLDEPTNGLDVVTTRAVRRLLLALKEEGKAVVFSSHLMHEVGHLCDRAIIIAGGRITASGTLDELRKRSGCGDLEGAFVHFAYPEETAHV